MPVKKWSTAQRTKFNATVTAKRRRANGPRITRMPRYVYVLRNGQFLKVRLQRVRAVTFGEIS